VWCGQRGDLFDGAQLLGSSSSSSGGGGGTLNSLTGASPPALHHCRPAAEAGLSRLLLTE